MVFFGPWVDFVNHADRSLRRGGPWRFAAALPLLLIRPLLIYGGMLGTGWYLVSTQLAHQWDWYWWPALAVFNWFAITGFPVFWLGWAIYRLFG